MNISVIVPSIGKKTFLLRALKSLENQEKKIDELILIFDIQENETTNEVKSFLESSHLNYKILFTEGSKGGSFARNLGIKESSNEIIMFLDEDDYWDPKKTLIQSESFKDQKCILSFTSRKIVSNKKLEKTLRTVLVTFNGIAFPKIMYKNIVGITSTVAARKKELIKAGLFDEKMPCRQDYDLWIRMSALGNFHGISDPLTTYTVFDDLSQVSSKYKNHILAAERLIFKHKDLVKKHSVNNRLFKSEKWFAVAKSARRTGFFKALPFALRSFILFPRISYLILFLPNFAYKRLGV